MSFGHTAIIGSGFRIDTWGAGPFMFRIDGKRVFFEDSDMFGPAVLRLRDWNPSDRQPSEKSRFWDAYGMWRKAGRPTRGRGVIKVAVWREPKRGTYWKDRHGVRWHLTDPDLDHLGYAEVPRPDAP